MKIIITPCLSGYGWHAIDDDTYDGPPAPCGHGWTPKEALDDLMDKTPSEDWYKRAKVVLPFPNTIKTADLMHTLDRIMLSPPDEETP